MQSIHIPKRVITFILIGITLFKTFKKYNIAIAMLKNTQISPKLFYILDTPILVLYSKQN